MRASCRVAAATLSVILAMVPVASAQQSTPAAEDGKLPSLAPKSQTPWPRTLPQSKPGNPPPEPPIPWSAQEIDAARAHCADLLKGLDVVVIPQAPISEGSECGTPAPVQLVSIGSNPQISFSPPPLLTCEMVAAVHRWLQHEVQPLAREHLGAPIVSVAVMSSFSCRFAKATGRLSEHGRANALDVGALLAADGQAAMVLADWGPIARELTAQTVAAKPDAARKQETPASRPAREAKAPRRVPVLANPIPGITTEYPSVTVGEPRLGTGVYSFGAPSHVGGPKTADTPDPETVSGKALFLRAAHRAACSIFSTVLGPEANKAHKNHFHLDMATRKNSNFCE